MKWILDLPLPSPQEQLGTVLAAWSDGGKTPGQRDVVADMIFFVGQDQVRVFNETIYQQLQEQHRDFHDIQDWWAKLSEKPIEYVCSFTTDANPAFRWNPFYSIIARHTRTTRKTTAQIKELVATSCGNYTK